MASDPSPPETRSPDTRDPEVAAAPPSSPGAPGDARNPLLSQRFPVPFHEITDAHIEPALRSALAEARAALARVAAASAEPSPAEPGPAEPSPAEPGPAEPSPAEPSPTAPSYEATVGALDALLERLGRIVVTVQHLNAVARTPAVREAWTALLPEVSAFYARLETDPGVWRALARFAASDAADALDPLRRRNLDKTLLAFRRSGADLPAPERARVEAIRVELSRLGNEFGNNLLDGTNLWELVLPDRERLAGLPPSALRMARRSAAEAGVDGYRLTLHAPSYLAVVTYAEDRELRREVHEAFRNRGSGEGRDNRPLLRRILALRAELARLLGYRDFAELTLEERMVEDASAVRAFEREMEAAVRPRFEAEIGDLDRKASELGLDRLRPWDLRYVEEKLRLERFDFDDERLRPWFSVGRVIGGLFTVAERLFGITIEEDPDEVAVWHASVRVYRVIDADGTHLGSFYTDWFPRAEKRGGAWMMPLVTGGPEGDGFAPHLAFIGGNLTPPDGERDALLTHDEVATLFHEFGHLLHHVMSRVEVRARAGTNVAWDFVELPSQLMENWIWEREALDLFARHVDDGRPLPDDLFERLRRSRTFGGARRLLWGVGLGTLDLELHTSYDPEGEEDPIAFGRRVMARFLVHPDFAEDDFMATFSHVFAGGYAAGYYSYLWSEVLDADAFGRFREAGIFDPGVGRAYVDAILARGDSADPAELYRDFMGRDPDPAPLLERNLGPAPERSAP